MRRCSGRASGQSWMHRVAVIDDAYEGVSYLSDQASKGFKLGEVGLENVKVHSSLNKHRMVKGRMR